MKVNGCDCLIMIKTTHCEMDIPYSEETIREAVSILHEEAAIEGDGVCRGIRKVNGVTGCVVTPLTLKTVHLLLYLAFGTAGLPVFVTETRSLFQYSLNLIPLEDTDRFDLIQDRRNKNEELGIRNERLLYEDCAVKGFELRIMRGDVIKLKLDICGERSPRVYPYEEICERESGERFSSDYVTYKINGNEYGNIYGLTFSCKKEGGTKTEIWIKRVLDNGKDLPSSIDELVITAKLLRDKYEYRHFGLFRITIKKLVLVSDETNINSTDAVIGPMRFYVSGGVNAEVFSSDEVLL